MGGGQSTDEKLDNVNKKLETMQHTIDSLPRTAGCDLQAVNRSVNGRLSAMETTISSSRDQLNEVNQRLDTMRDNMITGVDGLNENIINSYYYISQQNNNIAQGQEHSLFSRDDTDPVEALRASRAFAAASTGPKKLSGLRKCDAEDQSPTAEPAKITGPPPCSWST